MRFLEHKAPRAGCTLHNARRCHSHRLSCDIIPIDFNGILGIAPQASHAYSCWPNLKLNVSSSDQLVFPLGYLQCRMKSGALHMMVLECSNSRLEKFPGQDLCPAPQPPACQKEWGFCLFMPWKRVSGIHGDLPTMTPRSHQAAFSCMIYLCLPTK